MLGRLKNTPVAPDLGPHLLLQHLGLLLPREHDLEQLILFDDLGAHLRLCRRAKEERVFCRSVRVSRQGFRESSKGVSGEVAFLGDEFGELGDVLVYQRDVRLDVDSLRG